MGACVCVRERVMVVVYVILLVSFLAVSFHRSR